jgi:hypothetical protein
MLRSRPAQSLIALAALCLVVGCGSTEPARSHVIPPGVYGHELIRFLPSGAQAKYTGTLTVTYASDDSIAGRWNVGGYQSAVSLGFWNVDAYVVSADLTGINGFANVRLAPVGDGGFSCSARFITVGSGGSINSDPVPCSLTGNGVPPEIVRIQSVSFGLQSITMKRGQVQFIPAVVHADAGFPDLGASYSVADSSIATTTSVGIVTALKAGQTTLIAKATADTTIVGRLAVVVTP